jgi:hypothetical protein
VVELEEEALRVTELLDCALVLSIGEKAEVVLGDADLAFEGFV